MHSIPIREPGVREGGASTKGNIIDEEYKEGIYVGYRWTDKERIKPTLHSVTA